MTTKTSRVLLASQSLLPGASVSINEWDLTPNKTGLAIVRLKNGVLGPTTVPIVKFYAGSITGLKRQIFEAPGDIVNDSTNDIPYRFPPETMYANITITNGATYAITVDIDGQESS